MPKKSHPEGTVPADQSGDAGALPADRRGGHGGGDDFFAPCGFPIGEKFLMESLSFLFGKQTIGPSRMVPVLVLAGVLLCLMVTGVCILLTSRLTGRITATLKTLRQAADNLRDGELDFQILSCDERELDELSHSLESVRQRLKATAVAEAAAQEERGLLMAISPTTFAPPSPPSRDMWRGFRTALPIPRKSSAITWRLSITNL